MVPEGTRRQKDHHPRTGVARAGRVAVVALGCLSAACSGARASRLDPMRDVSVTPCPPLTEPRLVFQSNFWLNLHNFLVKEAKRGQGIDDDGVGARGNVTADTTGLRVLEPAERRAWNAALAYYAREVLTDRMGGGDSIVARVNDRLAAAPETEPLAAPGLDSSLAATLVQVAPIYRAVWWPIHDAHNRAWIASSRGLVDRYGGCVFPRLQQTLRRPWPAEPITVHATTYASWFGAYSTTTSGPRTTISSNAVGNQETYALEAVLHESAHAAQLLAASESAMTAAAAARGVTLQPELSHLILFYTTGEIVAGVIPAHVPYADRFGIWSQNREAERLRAVMAESWKPYLAGRASFDDALAAVVAGSRR